MLDHEALLSFAAASSVPVVNGLTRRCHPCQIVADLMTVEERFGSLEGRTIAWVGDGNNVAATFLEAAPLAGFALRVASPDGFALPPKRVAAARAAGASVALGTDPRAAVDGADVVVTDTWTSMGDADEARRRETFAPYQVDEALMAHAAPHAIFLHCLPAHRGEEVTDAVMDGPPLRRIRRGGEPRPRPEGGARPRVRPAGLRLPGRTGRRGAPAHCTYMAANAVSR